VNQQHLIFTAQFLTAEKGILCRTPHIHAGDDVQNFCHAVREPPTTRIGRIGGGSSYQPTLKKVKRMPVLYLLKVLSDAKQPVVS
jgi:hypothetical protein